ncbi:hypothetical protein [Burkholderia ubonensis]|uniref:hypothetical protein n=1 Tax=Burkholderia ubonensis TaxID=101571 RepID=UPI001E64838A|nr:hypothetical protein [Burkholderia ubonensis]
MEELDDRIGRLQPERLADERERCRVQRVLVDDVAVAMNVLSIENYVNHDITKAQLASSRQR